ncbi:ABC-2 type transport system permease protein [Faunimonas pinastri]|uniref:ABC-2 type transport system permease protein n=1 Tax=Faunimonas pinastri TaxID=1855383 RepID=A0A1H9AQP1_9HYPH|nr:permease [Faunimonas pinastri]SEP79096.1 ABC-2 type transport system permease protein [Faunimonas pinastri]
MSGRPGSLGWIARHEIRLSWRDWVGMMSAGGRRRTPRVILLLLIFAAFLHAVAFATVGRFGHLAPHADRATLVMITGSVFLSWCLVLSQALESVTRAFYARSDLDLILSSPLPARKIFAVRIGAISLSSGLVSMLLAGSFINVLAFTGGPHWLLAYPTVAALSALATSLAVIVCVVLFRLLGPRRTRFAAQVLAAVIGAGFVVGIQAVAIFSSGTFSRLALLQSPALLAHAPGEESLLWAPARAMLGDVPAFLETLAFGLAVLFATTALLAGELGKQAAATSGAAHPVARRSARRRPFRIASPAAALRRKEWTLLIRDPWLISQTLMQVIYLFPAALLLWRNYHDAGSLVVLAPVMVMAAGQLGGGLAWLAISGEDAPDLVASAPIGPRAVIRAKVEAVMGSIALIFAPLVLALAFASPYVALVSMAGVFIAAGAATVIQLWFRAQAKRSNFRRRQTSSRLATFAEAFSSLTWASAAALAAAGTWFALFPALLAVAILGGTRWLSPKT